MTLLFLGIVLLAWNLSFYQELYLDHASAAFRRDKAATRAEDGVTSREFSETRTDAARGGAISSGASGRRGTERGGERLVAPPDPERIALGVDEGAGGAADEAGAEPAVVDVVLSYRDGGELRARGTRIDGLREGEWIEYYPNGKEMSRGFYVGDLRDGPWVEFYPSGQRKQEGAYREGLREGSWRSWHENGGKRSEGDFREGLRVEAWAQYYTDGRVMEYGRYENGLRQGLWTFLTADGEEDPLTGWYEAGRFADR